MRLPLRHLTPYDYRSKWQARIAAYNSQQQILQAFNVSLIYTYIHTNVHYKQCIHTHTHAQAFEVSFIYTYIHTNVHYKQCIHTHTHAQARRFLAFEVSSYIHTYIQMYTVVLVQPIHTHTHTQKQPPRALLTSLGLQCA